MAEEISLFEAIYTQRALRHLKPDPVPDELIKKVIDAGIHAPNGGNQQRWAFVVIKDPALKAKLAEPYKAEGHPDHGDAATWSQRNAEASADYLANHAAEVPVWILACTEHAGTDISHGASIYPAVQNMLLAARALGLPEDHRVAIVLAFGHPASEESRHRGIARTPVAELTHIERW